MSLSLVYNALARYSQRHKRHLWENVERLENLAEEAPVDFKILNELLLPSLYRRAIRRDESVPLPDEFMRRFLFLKKAHRSDEQRRKFAAMARRTWNRHPSVYHRLHVVQDAVGNDTIRCMMWHGAATDLVLVSQKCYDCPTALDSENRPERLYGELKNYGVLSKKKPSYVILRRYQPEVTYLHALFSERWNLVASEAGALAPISASKKLHFWAADLDQILSCINLHNSNKK